MHKLILLILSLSICFSVIGQEEDEKIKHPIDFKLGECLENESNYTTLGIISCYETASKAWDTELNRYYKLLMTVLKKEAKAKLKASQRNWINYRDTEYDFSNQMHSDMEGTMWIIVGAERKCEVVKSRALELKDYYETYTFDKE